MRDNEGEREKGVNGLSSSSVSLYRGERETVEQVRQKRKIDNRAKVREDREIQRSKRDRGAKETDE